MEDAWQQDIAPSNSGISIPTQDTVVGQGPVSTDDYNGGGGRSPGRDRERERESRRSRSRSPGGRDDRDRDRGRGGDGGTNPGNNLHVSGLSHKVDSRDLEAAFAKIGRVQKASVMYDPHTRDSRGFGFVTMETAEEADAAVTALNATEFMGKVLSIQKARRGRARTPTPGRYHGPPKRGDYDRGERQYDPRPYDSRYARDYDDRRGGGRRYDDRGDRSDRGGGRDYDRGHRDYDRGERGYGGRGDYRDDRGGGGGRYDDRRY